MLPEDNKQGKLRLAFWILDVEGYELLSCNASSRAFKKDFSHEAKQSHDIEIKFMDEKSHKSMKDWRLAANRIHQ